MVTIHKTTVTEAIEAYVVTGEANNNPAVDLVREDYVLLQFAVEDDVLVVAVEFLTIDQEDDVTVISQGSKKHNIPYMCYLMQGR